MVQSTSSQERTTFASASPIPTTNDTYSYTYQAVTAHDGCTIPPSSKHVRLKNLGKVTEK